jgi:hypothetical protein
LNERDFGHAPVRKMAEWLNAYKWKTLAPAASSLSGIDINVGGTTNECVASNNVQFLGAFRIARHLIGQSNQRVD